MIIGAVIGGLIGFLLWYVVPDNLRGKRQNAAIEVPDLEAPIVEYPIDIPKANKGAGFLLAGLGAVAVLWFCLSLAIAIFIFTLIYGVIVIIFRSAFGVELPHPAWL